MNCNSFFLLVSQCPTDLPNLSFPNCAPYPGQTCDFECKPGYRSTLNTTIACISGGIWTPNTQLLCEGNLTCHCIFIIPVTYLFTPAYTQLFHHHGSENVGIA